jgi:hypothetical protein
MGRCITLHGAILALLFFTLARAARNVEDGSEVHILDDVTPIDTPGAYYDQLHPCPKTCDDKKPENWTVYSSEERLGRCDQPMLLDFAVFNPIDDPTTGIMIRTCAVGGANSLVNNTHSQTNTSPDSNRRASTCMQTGVEAKISLDLAEKGNTTANTSDLVDILQHLQDSFESEANCYENVLFGRLRSNVVGIYIGSAFGKATISSVITAIKDQVRGKGSSSQVITQRCGSGLTANHVFGIAVDTTASLGNVQSAVAKWAKAECVKLDDHVKTTMPSLSIWESNDNLNGTLSNNTVATNGTLLSRSSQRLHRRGDCTTITVQPGDGCPSLASKCGISPSDFTKYNPNPTLCSNLKYPQQVCCSAGTLPVPKPNADGTCATYLVKKLDTCDDLALQYSITADQIDSFNKGRTWGWTDCPGMQANINICLSSGNAPMPATYDNAVCGPVKPGTQPPTNSSVNLADLNPCPLKACCNVWGQCGITGDFCTVFKSPTGNPGYSPPGKNACVSSCGQDIVNKDKPPASFQRVGYYETWNFNRPCLNLRVANANTDGSYTHIHWAFAAISTSDWTPQIDNSFNQWNDFKALTGVKRVISFGGWGYSTDPATCKSTTSPVFIESNQSLTLNLRRHTS